MKKFAKVMQAIAFATLPLISCNTHKQNLPRERYMPYGIAVPISDKVPPLDNSAPATPLASRTNELSDKAKEFHSLLKGAAASNSVKMVFDFLDKLSFKDDCGNEDVKLHVASREEGSLGDESYFYIGDETNRYDKLYQYLYAEPSAEAAWQIYLLYTSSNVMPVYWHGGYARRYFIFDEAAVGEIDGFLRGEKPLKGFDLRGLSNENLLLPEVKMSHGGRQADVCCTYWNDWKGLVRDHLRISFLKDGKVELTRVDPEILIAYDCGICF